MENFSLRFKISQIHLLAKEYENTKYFKKSRDKGIEENIAEGTKKVGYYTRQDFLTVCEWKSPRRFKLCQENSAEFIKEVTKTALSSPNEQLRIEILTILRGVSWATASVLLHFGSKDQYPILDFRALWSLKTEVPKQYDFSFWWAYVLFCRNLSKKIWCDHAHTGSSSVAILQNESRETVVELTRKVLLTFISEKSEYFRYRKAG